MNEPDYSRFAKMDLILRDELAIERTYLANERTLLSYLRSAVALFIAGMTIIHFSDQGWFYAVGVGCIPLSVVTAIVGVVRCHKTGKALSIFRKKREAESKNPNTFSI
jgi:putative membrane protein